MNKDRIQSEPACKTPQRDCFHPILGEKEVQIGEYHTPLPLYVCADIVDQVFCVLNGNPWNRDKINELFDGLSRSFSDENIKQTNLHFLKLRKALSLYGFNILRGNSRDILIRFLIHFYETFFYKFLVFPTFNTEGLPSFFLSLPSHERDIQMLIQKIRLFEVTRDPQKRVRGFVKLLLASYAPCDEAGPHATKERSRRFDYDELRQHFSPAELALLGHPPDGKKQPFNHTREVILANLRQE